MSAEEAAALLQAKIEEAIDAVKKTHEVRESPK